MNVKQDKEKILLLLLPFWDPQIPPLGIASLKSYLKRHHFDAKAYDLNINIQFRSLYDKYFDILKQQIPVDKQGNIYNIGNQVIRNHMMAHINNTDDGKYFELIKILVWNTFFIHLEDQYIYSLEELIQTFFSRFRQFLGELLEKEKPSVLGISVYGDTFAPSLDAFRLAKRLNPSIKTVMGGGIFSDQLAKGTPDLEYFASITRDCIDKIVVGEGEEIFLQLLRFGFDKYGRILSLLDIQSPGVDLACIDSPDFSDFDTDFYPHLAHYSGRSCPFQCKFCSETINWGKYRKKNVAQTVREFEELYKNYSHQLFLLTDSTLNPIIKDLSIACIENGTPFYWDGFLRADRHVLDHENTILWRRGGFYRAKLGLESGSQRVLDLMNKKITVEQSRDALRSLADAGIKTTTFWLFGFPGETEEDFRMTLDFLERCKDDIYEADCNPFNYYLNGQANSDEWRKNNKGVRLYPEWAKEFLITEIRILAGEPTREDAYKRVNRFVSHCSDLGIPNPYSLSDVYKADERWKQLHRNAVPPLVAFRSKDSCIDECRNVDVLVKAENANLADEDFDF